MQRPKLKDQIKEKRYERYPLGSIPDEYIIKFGKWMAYYFAVGKADIDGEDWGDIFAKAIDGEHMNSPIGLADVCYEGMAWSAKSVKVTFPHKCKTIRIISGRCSPDYSYGITDVHKDIALTGRAVLGIWNERVNIAKDKFEPLRSSILIRNSNTLAFTFFETELHRFSTNDYEWNVNRNGNLIGTEIGTGIHRFTWQPHGSQFTILYSVPPSAKNFIVRRPPVLDFDETMNQIGFDETWVTICK